MDLKNRHAKLLHTVIALTFCHFQGASPYTSLILAGIAGGTFGAVASHPFDTAKTRMQVPWVLLKYLLEPLWHTELENLIAPIWHSKGVMGYRMQLTSEADSMVSPWDAPWQGCKRYIQSCPLV
eukprot:1148073-Pelagomonas_calceolata.AAC.21